MEIVETTSLPSAAPSTSPLSCRNRELDVVIVIDRSGSISDDNFDNLKQFAADLSAEFTLGDDPMESRFSLVSFGQGADVLVELDDGVDNAAFAAAALGATRGNVEFTWSWAGLGEAYEEIDTPRTGTGGQQVPRAVIFLSDGTPESNSLFLGSFCNQQREFGRWSYTRNQKEFHCTRYWAQRIFGLSDTSLIYIQLPFGGGAGNPDTPEAMEGVLLRNTAPLRNDNTGIPKNDPPGYLRLLATDFNTILQETLAAIQVEVCT